MIGLRPTYRERLYNLCTSTDLKDEAEVISTMQLLAGEALRYHDLALRLENKLKEHMTAAAFEAWSLEQAKADFKKEVDEMADGGFKSFLMACFDEITGDIDEL